MGELTAEDFRGVQGSRFQMTAVASSPIESASAPSFEAELVEVTEQSRGASDGFRTPFSVVFHGPLEPVMGQGTYRVENDVLGTLELFLVPLGPDPEKPTAMQYEAVFG